VQAWAVETPGPIDSGPLRLGSRPLPVPGPGEIRVRVSVCGVCRTDLHLCEGDLAPRHRGVVPGHEVVGTVDAVGLGAARFALGDRVGIAWLHRSCGRCRFCAAERENLCLEPTFTGWDTDGGYAEHAVVHEDFAYALPPSWSDVDVAPLLCAGIIGYRALRRTELPPGGRLGIYGFGASAHLTAQLALGLGATVHVRTRSPEAATLALELGCHTSGPTEEPVAGGLDGAIVFAPAGEIVPIALEQLDRGGTCAVAGIHLSDIPPLVYARHLFQERTLRSVTANTRADGAELFRLAEELAIRPVTTVYPFGAVDRALSDLAHDRVTGAAVVQVA